VYADESGPAMATLLKQMESKDYPLTFDIAQTQVVPDDGDAISAAICAWSDPHSSNRVDIVLSSGGTGFGERDFTPEVMRKLLHREAPGIAQALLSEGLKHTPLALLSRPVVGTRHHTFIATLPGSVKAVRENIACLKPLLPRICELLKTNDCNPRFNK
jgi:molybdenum cofactor synthesis domain-containing protein